MDVNQENSTNGGGAEGELPPPETPEVPKTPVLTGKRANWTVAHEIAQDGTAITWQVKGAGKLTLSIVKVNEANRARAALHGFVQRVSDAAAMPRDSKTGASATPQEKFEAMKRLVAHYESGAEGWSPQRSVEGVGRPKSENPSARLLRIALSLFNSEKPQETIEKFVKGLGVAQIVALLNSEQLKDCVELAREQLREEELKAAEGQNAEELLKGL